MFLSTLREAVRRRREAESDRDFWKQEASRLAKKLEERTDFFIEREFRLVDRAITKNGGFAITDEIRAKRIVGAKDTEDYAKEAYLNDKKAALVEWAKEAGLTDPEAEAARTFEQNRSEYIVEFEQQRIN